MVIVEGIDDVDYSGQGGIATTFDIDQVEVHRGPQGSRIGSNALAGLIYIKTKEPTDRLCVTWISYARHYRFRKWKKFAKSLNMMIGEY